MAGWHVPYLALSVGFKVVLSNQFSDAKTHMKMICEQGVSIYSGVPTVMQRLRLEYESNPAQYKAIKQTLSRIITGGKHNYISLSLHVEYT